MDCPTQRRRAAAAATLVLLAALACGGDAEREPAAGPDADLAIVGVTLLNPRDEEPGPPATVLVAGDRITAVGAVGDLRVPADARRVAGDGLYLLPGLWDLHTHLTLPGVEGRWDEAPRLLVTQGVTGVRDLGARPREIKALRDRILAGELLGPRIVRAGPTLNGSVEGPHHRLVDSPEAAHEAVAELAADGVDLIKNHNQTPRATYFALLEAAADHGLTVAGHVPVSVDPLEACQVGQASVEHIATLFEGTYLSRFADEREAFEGMRSWLDTDLDRLVACFAEHGVLFVPTLRAYDLRAHRAAAFDDPDPQLRYLRPDLVPLWRPEPTAVDRNPEVIRLRESLVEVGQEVVRRLHEAGAPVGAGTDLAIGILPGFDLHAEIRLLSAAGLGPREALWTSVRGPGPAAGGDPLQGRLVPGAPADLVLLRENAFADLAALGTIEAVVLRGELLDRARLDRTLADLEAR